MTIEVELQEAMKSLPDLLRRAVAGDEIILAEDSKPVGRILPYGSLKGQRIPGTARGKYVMREDFDAPLPDDIMKAFEG